MKQILAVLVLSICLSICHKANAQNAVYLAPDPQTAKWSYIETDSKGQQTATIYNSVEYIKGDAVNGKLKLRIEEVPVESPKDTSKSFVFYRFKDGEYAVDMNAMFENDILGDIFGSAIDEKYPELTEDQKNEVLDEIKTKFKVSGEIRGIPRYPKVGKLPDYDYQFKFSLMNTKVQGEGRKIVGTERIQTEAGSFDCFILEETITTKILMMKEVEKIRSWYAYGIGLVKEITYDKNGKLVSTMILNGINW